jgi:Zn-dependent M28 family amino/carboxypeptidase
LAISSAAATAAPAPAPAARLDALRAIAERLQAEERKSQGAWHKLAYLTDHIGARLSGSPQADKAVAWALAEFGRDGFAEAHAENVMVPHWERGEGSGAIVSPVEAPLALLALGMSDGTPPEGVTGEVVEADSFESLRALGDKARGKVVLLNKPMRRAPDGAGYGEVAPLRHGGPSQAARQGAVAFLIRSLGTLAARLPHTGTTHYDDDAPRIPAAAVSEEDADRIHRLLAAGETVKVRLTLGCRMLPDAPSANVVAEWRGAKRPDEVVVISGHLDSWDVGAGAEDDGAGVVMAMESLALLKRLDLHPARTVRAVLYMNEENGTRGGHGYADQHAAEMARHVAALEADSGAGPWLGYAVLAGPGGAGTVRALAGALALPHEVTDGGEGGTDIGPMRAAGVPLLGVRFDMTHYFDWHHTAADTLDKIDPANLADGAVVMALMGYALADLDPPLPRVPPEARADERK